MGSKTTLWIPERRLKGMRVAEMELYPRTNWKRAIAITVATFLLGGVAGYRWITTVTPVDRTTAVELFRAERDEIAASAGPTDEDSVTNKARNDKGDRLRGMKGTTRSKPGSVVASSGRPSQAGSQQRASSSATTPRWEPPEEGVYSWATDGYEQVPGARRDFPEETQRILTLNGGGNWTEHHYFSEQRESWTFFHWGERGAEVTKQRNKIVFGPITNDSSIDFSPPMLVGPKRLEVGYEWSDSWTGDTYGDYSNKIFEHTTLDIGGETVEVWGMSYVINLHGDQEGQVNAKVWLAADYSMTVQEHYEQDVESDGVKYHAEWTQKLKSLHPEQ